MPATGECQEIDCHAPAWGVLVVQVTRDTGWIDGPVEADVPLCRDHYQFRGYRLTSYGPGKAEMRLKRKVAEYVH